MATTPATFDEYCRRYLAFLDAYAGVPVVRYEDFVASPQRAIERVADFLGPGCVDGSWARRVADHVRQSSARVDDVDAAELHALADACAPGFAALRGLYPEMAL